MPIKLKEKPFCRMCGKAIPKFTSYVYVYAKPPQTHYQETRSELVNGRFEFVPTGAMKPMHVPTHIVGAPKTKAEAQTMWNEQIVSVSRNNEGAINRLGVWDGESYVDSFFCSNSHAIKFAYAAVRMAPELGTDAWRKAAGKMRT